jgi:hypothetical protein
MASVSLIESGERTRAIAKCRAGIAGETFKDALARIMSDEASAVAVKIVRVAVTAGYASIETEDGSHVFVGPHHEKAAVSITVAIGGDTVQAFAKVVSGAGPNVR